jgi:hypothetical protein
MYQSCEEVEEEEKFTRKNSTTPTKLVNTRKKCTNDSKPVKKVSNLKARLLHYPTQDNWTVHDPQDKSNSYFIKDMFSSRLSSYVYSSLIKSIKAIRDFVVRVTYY